MNKPPMNLEDEVGSVRLGRALASMYHEQGSDQVIMNWYGKQKDFWGGVQSLKKLLWPFAAAFGPLNGLYRTHDIRLACKRLLNNASVSKAQLAVSLTEMGFAVLFMSPEKFNTNFPCKRVVEKFKSEGQI